MKKLRHILRRRKKTILFSFVLLFLPAAAAAIIFPSIYASQTTIRVDGRTPEAIDIQLLSRNHLLGLISSLNLYPELRARYSTEQILEKMKKDIHFKVIEKKANGSQEDQSNMPASTTFMLTYEGTDPGKVEKTLNALTELYIKEAQTSETPVRRMRKDVLTPLEQETAALKEKMQAFQTEINNLKKVYIGEISEVIQSNQRSLNNLKQALKRNDSRIIRLKKEIIKLQNQLAGTNPMSRESRRRIEIAERPLNKLRDRLVDLESRLTDKHPDIVSLKEKIQVKEKEVQEIIRIAQEDKSNRTYVNLKTKIESHELEIVGLKSANTDAQKEINIFRKKIVNAGSVQNRLNALNFELQEATNRYQEASARLNDAKNAFQAAAVRSPVGPQITVIEPAHLPDLPLQPNRVMMILAGFAFFVFFGSGLAFLRERFDTSIKSINQLKSISNLPVLSSIPKVVTKKERWARRFSTSLKLLFLLGCALVALGYVHFFLTPLNHLLTLVQSELTMYM